MPKFEKYKEKFLTGWDNVVQKSDEDSMAGLGRERIVVFIVSLLLALSFWLLVNLSRDYNLNVDLPVSLGMVPEEQALAADLPDEATVSVSGEGWKLINLYNNPPNINVDVTASEVNLYDQVQQQMNALPDISVQKVQPLILNLQLEERISKKVPVESRVNVSFQEQYDFLQTPDIEPDSITVSGAKSLIEEVISWETDSVHIEEVSGNLSRTVSLKDSTELISLSQEEVIFDAQVTQFTEGEKNVNLDTQNIPSSRSISFSPSRVTVKYDIPINEYNEIEDIQPFEAFITFEQIEEDSSGFVTPQIEKNTDEYHINIRSFQPSQVAYFMVLDE